MNEHFYDNLQNFKDKDAGLSSKHVCLAHPVLCCNWIFEFKKTKNQI
jgi:hypothetical protein